MPAYKCKIAVSGGEVIEKVIKSNSASSLKKNGCPGWRFSC